MGLAIWVVYDHPSDYPEVYVARRWMVSSAENVATGEVMQHESLEQLRRAIFLRTGGLVRMPRRPDDDPTILECWL